MDYFDDFSRSASYFVNKFTILKIFSLIMMKLFLRTLFWSKFMN